MQVSPAAQQAMTALEHAGFSAWLVGGCVRDALRGVPPHDWDMATNAKPAQLLEVFQGWRVIETGIRHGTVTVLIDATPVEISTLRGETLAEDLARRDFSMNALAWNPVQGLADPYGGAADLAAGRIRAVGSAEERFAEDPLRILRALRFSAKLGMEIEPDLEDALNHCREKLNLVSAERIRSELEQLLCAPGAGDVLRRFREIAGVLIPELSPMFDFQQRNSHHCFDLWEHALHTLEAAPPEPVLRWAALFHDLGKPRCFRLGADGQGHFYGHAELGAQMADRILERLRLSRAERERIVLLIRRHDAELVCEEKSVRRALSRLGGEAFFQLLSLKRADALAQGPDCTERLAAYDALEGLAKQILASRPVLSRADLDVNGSDMLALGLKGPEIRDALDLLLEAVLSGKLRNERGALLAYLAGAAEKE